MSTRMRTVRSESAGNLSIAQPGPRYDNKITQKRPQFPLPRVPASNDKSLGSSPGRPGKPARAALGGVGGPKAPILPELVADHTSKGQQQNCKLPRRSCSSVFRATESAAVPGLPERTVENTDLHSEKRCIPRRSYTTSFRAAESGRDYLLPMTGSRARVSSSDNLAREWSGSNSSGTKVRQESSQSLRSRRSSRIFPATDENLDDKAAPNTPWAHQQTRRDDSSAKIRRKQYSLNQAFVNIQAKKLLCALMILGIFLLVADSYHRILITSGHLTRFQKDESMIFLHLDRVEQQVRTLHEQFEKVKTEDLKLPGQKAGAVDDELLQKQMQQLEQMEQELSHEVRALQSNVQVSARSSILEAYGEGPVQVVLDLDYGDMGTSAGTRMAILLWYDTPHAAWTLLQQVEAGLWNGATFSMDKGRTISAAPANPDPDTNLHFIEKSARKHDPWTVGLSDFGDDGIGLFINLKDNSEYHENDVCVGKIVDGFDALQQLVSQTRSRTNKVIIKEAKARHLTRTQSSNLV